MSDAIQTYGIRIKSMQENLRNLKNMKKSMDSVQKHQRRVRSRAMIQNKNNIASETKFAQQMREQEAKDFRKTQKALTQTQREEAKKREQIELAAAKKQYGEQTARRRQAVGKITERAGEGRGTASRSALADMLREEAKAEKEAYTINAKKNRLEQQRLNSLEKAKKAIERSALMQKRDASAAEEAAQQAIRKHLATAKTADELRDAVAQEKASLSANKRLTKEMKQQMFLQRRITESSKQFAGNYVSAFAAAGAATGITRVGQELESVKSTMMAVSSSTEQAEQNFEFAKKEAVRLGGSFVEIGKGYSKLLAAGKEQDISIGASQKALTGLLESSTVLGLSADDSAGAIRALQQSISKGQLMAKLVGHVKLL